MEKTPFKGRVYMTHPTKAIYKWLLADYVKVTGVSGGGAHDEDQLYTEVDLARSYERITAIDYHQEIDYNGVRFVALNAGHVLGAAMFMIEIAGARILYTGDYSREEDRHLMAAETPTTRPDVLVCESTYGVHSHQPRLERERRFTSLVHSIVGRGGRCLIPVFALGRAQELLLILDEYWQAHPELHSIPVYYASALAKKCMAVYQTYVNMMNDRIRRQIALSNPFIFKHVSNLRSMDQFTDDGPCVMMASPAMLQSGLSRELLERWCSSPRNGLIIPGYVVEGTLAKTLLSEPKEITAISGARLPMRMTIEYISFSAHVDFGQNSEFIDTLKPPHVILVHGEAGEMQRLKVALQHRYKITALTSGNTASGANPTSSAGWGGFTIGGPLPETVCHVHTPRNCESVELICRGEKAIKVVGRLAETAKNQGPDEPIQGILVGKDFEYQLMTPEDLAEFVPNLRPVRWLEKQIIQCRAPFSLVEYLLIQVYGRAAVTKVNTKSEDKKLPPLLTIEVKSSSHTRVQVTAHSLDSLLISWEGDPLTDLLADSIVMLLLGADSSRAAVKATASQDHDASHHHHGSSIVREPEPEQIRIMLKSYLKNYYGTQVEETRLENDGDECLQLRVAGHLVNILSSDYSVICEDHATFEQISETITRFLPLIHPDIVI